jgi:polyhydroxybutyrate depolymerase
MGSGGAAGDAAPASDSGPAPSDTAQGACTAGTLKPGNTNLTIPSGGAMRSYIVHVPPMYDGKTRMPLVVDMHGAGDTAAHQITWSGWREKADAVGIVVIYPQGIGNTWNGGPNDCPLTVCCCNPAQSMKIDDMAFIRAVVAKTAQDGCIDSRRVYATGLSNGGIMSQWLACGAADVFAGVAPVSGPNMVMDCKLSRPISVVLYRGRMDVGVLYNGGMPPGGTHVWPSAMADFDRWGNLDKCTDAPVAMPMHPVCQIRSKCEGGAEVVLCSPNAPHNLYGTVMSQMVGVADVAWEVFQRRPLP